MRWLPRFAAIGAVALLLSGCGSLLPAAPPPPSLYRLSAVDDFPAAPRPMPVQLVVETSAADAALDTSRIALTRGATGFDYFADAAWTDRLPAMVRALVIESLENAHRIEAVGGPSGALRADDVLTMDLRHFEAVYRGAGTPRWRIEITAQLVREPARKVLAVRTFRAEARAARNAMPEIVTAADSAWRGVARRIVDWTADKLSVAR